MNSWFSSLAYFWTLWRDSERRKMAYVLRSCDQRAASLVENAVGRSHKRTATFIRPVVKQRAVSGLLTYRTSVICSASWRIAGPEGGGCFKKADTGGVSAQDNPSSPKKFLPPFRVLSMTLRRGDVSAQDNPSSPKGFCHPFVYPV